MACEEAIGVDSEGDEVDSEADSSEEGLVVEIVVALAVVASADEEDSKADHQAVDTEAVEDSGAAIEVVTVAIEAEIGRASCRERVSR